VEQFRQASAFVIGGYTPYSSLDARTKMFMERMYCLRHNRGLNRGKPGVAVVTTACAPDRPGLPPAAQLAHQQLALWMMEEGMPQVGSLTVVGNVPCVRCGFGDSCEHSGIKMLHGPAATVASVGTTAFELQPAVLAEARELGAKLKAAVLAARA
jgi:multimeric flavodoxin WrbA